VAVTHDYTKGLELERGAMDLARARGVDLATATDAVAKAAGGNTKALKTLVPGLKLGATAAETLSNAFAAVSGEAEAYVNTTAGKLEKAQVSIGEKMEDFGYRILPIVAGALDVLNASIDVATLHTDENKTAVDTAAGTYSKWGAIMKTTAQISAASAGDFREDGRNISKTFSDVASSADTSLGGVKTDAINAAAAFDKMVADMGTAADKLISDAYDPIIAHEELLATEVELATLKQLASKRKLTSEERKRLAELQKDEAEHLVTLAEAGQTTSGAYTKGIADLKTQIKNAHGPMKKELQDILNSINNIKSAGKSVPINLLVIASGGGGGNSGQQKARGGPVTKGQTYIVGENRPELFVPDTNGTILPQVPQAGAVVPFGAAQGGGNSMTVIFQSTWPPSKEQARDIARVLDEAQYSSVQSAAAYNGRV
jgi:hypothetical protein